MPKIARPVVLSESNREQLQSWVRAQFTPQQVVLRSRILLMAAEGKQDLEIASELEINRHTPALWRKRFHAEGLDGVWETRSGRGCKPSYDQEKVAALRRVPPRCPFVASFYMSLVVIPCPRLSSLGGWQDRSALAEFARMCASQQFCRRIRQ